MNRVPKTEHDVGKIVTFLSEHRKAFTVAQWQESYHSWAHGGSGWHRLRCGGTDIHAAITWYQHVHKPGSKEWRPKIIIDAVCRCAGVGEDAA